MSVDMKQAIKLDINESNYDFSKEEFQEMNKYNDFLLSKSLAKFSTNNMSISQIPSSSGRVGSSAGGGRGGCPFLNRNTFRDIETPILPHYEMKNLIYYPYDFFFELINYKTNDLINKSKKIRNIPKFIRNTLFLNDETIKRVRKMNFNQSFIIGEQLKETTEKMYKEGNYYEALQQYNLIYSLFRWLEFKDKKKEETLLKDVTKISDMPIIDDDVILKRCAVNNPERRRKAELLNTNFKENGTIDDSVSYNSDDEEENKKNEEKKKKEESEDEKSNISDNFINREDEEEESSEGEEEEDDEEEEENGKEKELEKKKESEKNKDNKKEKKTNINEIKEKNLKDNKINNIVNEKKIINNKKEKEKEKEDKETKTEKKIEKNKNIIKEKEKKEILKENKKEEEKKNDDDEMEELYKYDLINFKKTMQLLLKRMGYCYIHLCSFSEAIECFNEAFKYVDDDCPDFYFRRAQARIYNKASTLNDLKNALGDLNKALSRKITYHSEILLREHKLVQELISKKEEQICLIPIKLLNNFRYAMNKIKKK